MKKERSKNKLTKEDYDKFPYEDTRHYGLFYSKSGDKFKVKIDPKRFCYSLNIQFIEPVMSVINSRKTHYFYPRKSKYHDYNCNVFETMIQSIKEYWDNHYKDLIIFANNRIEKPDPLIPAGNDAFMRGVIDYDEVSMINRFEKAQNEMRYEQECYRVINSMYASFIHQMASQIESVAVYVLNRENAMKNTFNRNMLYSTAVGKNMGVTDLPSFKYYDMLYCLWNFIKHNSLSTFEKLYSSYPELLPEDVDYEQGIPAYSVIKFSDNLIIELLDGCSSFFKEYCKLVFDEDYDEAQWNNGDFFYEHVRDFINMYINPMNLPYYL